MNNVSVSTQVYREIDPTADNLLQWLDQRQQLFNVTDPKGNEHLFVDNDTPRDADITPLIVQHTVGFALFTDDGEYIGSYRDLARAISAQESAQVVVTADVDAEPDEDILADAEA
jgi:hypothetical protein